MNLNHYTKAPIKEALIDLQVDLPPEVRVSTLQEIRDHIAPEYSQSEEIMTFQIEAIADAPPKIHNSHVGSRFFSVDKTKIVQARLNGFTYSQLAPYENWETLRNEAKRLWTLYKEVANPRLIRRVAVRYVNQLDLPFPFHDFKDYLRTVPEISPDLPQGLSDYVMQLLIPQPDLDASLVLRTGIVPPPNSASAGKVVSVALDIDLFCETSLDPDEEKCWDVLEKFRIRKNEIFNACITDKFKELIR